MTITRNIAMQRSDSEKLNFRDPNQNHNMQQPTPDALLQRLNAGDAVENRKLLSRKIIEKAKKNKEKFSGPEYLSLNVENIIADTELSLQNKLRVDLKAIPDTAQNWLVKQQGNKPLLTINANASYVGGILWSKNHYAQEERVAEESDLPLHIPSGGKTYTYSNKQGEPGLEKMGGSYRVCNVNQYELNNKSPDGIKQTAVYDAVFVAAPDFRMNDKNISVNGENANSNRMAYINEMAKKIRMQCEHALANGNNVLGAGALGCGAFNNNPFLVAAIFRLVLSEPKYKNIAVDFVIVDYDLCDKFNAVFNAPLDDVIYLIENAKPFDTSVKIHVPTNKTENLTTYERRYKVMEFHNNFLLGMAHGKPDAFMNEQQKEWLKEIEKNYQDSIRVYVNEEYANNIKFEFDRPGQYPMSEYFKPYTYQPKKMMGVDEYETLKDGGFFAPEWDEKTKQVNTEEDRQYTKHRVIVSKVPVLDENGKLVQRYMLTTCAPNLMDSSKADERKYLRQVMVKNKNGKSELELNEAEYQKTCDELAYLIIYAAAQNQISPLDIAEFGLGVYLKRFDNNEKPEIQKNIARKCMYQAFDSAAKAYGIEINWLIYENDKNADKMLEDRLVNFPRYKHITFKKGNILNSLNSLNNGSDRTIGGKTNAFYAHTTEEQVFQESFLLQTQTDFNPFKSKNINYLNVNQMIQDNLPHKPYKLNLGKGSQDGVDRYAQLIFDNEYEAKQFAEKDLFEENQICSFNNKNLPVNVRAEHNNFIIRLNSHDFDKLEGKNAYNELLLATFIQENKLDLSNPDNREFWTKQVGSSGGKSITYEAGNEKVTFLVPSSIEFIDKTLKNQYLNAQGKINVICDELSSWRYSSMLTFGRSDNTQHIIDEAQKLKKQFTAIPVIKITNEKKST